MIARNPMAVFVDLLGIPDDLGGQGLAWVRVAVATLLDAFPNLRLDPAQPPAFRYGARGFVQHGTDDLNVLL